MERHPYFDLWLYTTQELSEHLGSGIEERVTLHEWPLSCVQLLRLADGRQFVYKSQLRATSAEPEFYAAVNSGRSDIPLECRSLFPHAELLPPLQTSVGMIFEYIVAPRLEDLELNEVENLEHSRRLLDILGQFPPDLPVYIDISSHEKWSAFVEETLSMLFGLIVSSQFLLTTTATLQKLADWSNSDAILTTFQVPSVLNHGDLSGDNVFVTPDGYKIIDWQRPVRGPAELDLASYLFTMGMEPSTHTRREIIQINWFLHLRWFVECKLHWFPPGKSYDRQVAELSNLILSPQG